VRSGRKGESYGAHVNSTVLPPLEGTGPARQKNYLRLQNSGVRTISTVYSSSRPTSMAKLRNHLT